jgi:hypothetical protein
MTRSAVHSPADSYSSPMTLKHCEPRYFPRHRPANRVRGTGHFRSAAPKQELSDQQIAEIIIHERPPVLLPDRPSLRLPGGSSSQRKPMWEAQRLQPPWRRAAVLLCQRRPGGRDRAVSHLALGPCPGRGSRSYISTSSSTHPAGAWRRSLRAARASPSLKLAKPPARSIPTDSSCCAARRR